ncbi:MAG: diguanylate cyclase [Rhodopseudomonas sp.]|nr:diguanylate cyclase [Rhodopseudomonas sp.]
MLLDIQTLSVVTVFVTVLVGCLLVFAGWQNRAMREPILWGAAFMVGGLGLGLVCLRGVVPDWLSIEVGNSFGLTAYAMLWAGARQFDRRPIRPVLPTMVAPIAIWLVACATPFFANDIHWRVVLSSALIGLLTLASAREIWRGRAEALMSRWPTLWVLFAYAAMLLARIVATLLLPSMRGPSVLTGLPFALLAFGTLVFTVVLAFLLLNMTKERTELHHKIASLIDPLTGVANRRAFIDGVNRRLARRDLADAPVTVLLFDLDHFKRINDRLGHATGDVVLQLFAAIAAETLGPDALFGRIGGEEFAAMAPVGDLGEAVAVAERVRRRFAAAAARHAAGTLTPSCSVGVTLASDAEVTIAGLLAAADQALYLAKANGRNRVECGTSAPGIAPSSPDDNDDAADDGSPRRWRRISAVA